MGQRKGLPGGFPEAIFVLEVRPDTREVVVGTAQELLSQDVKLGEMNWLVPEDRIPRDVEIQLRHRAKPAPAVLERRGATVHLRLAQPQKAVTPGQSGVLFDGTLMLGGGRILPKE